MSEDCITKYELDNDQHTCRCIDKPKLESPFHHSSRLKMSPANFRTPIRVNRLVEIREEEAESKGTCSTSQTAPFVLLPSHSTPPPQEKKIRNPFDAALIKRLHLPVVSPSIFKRVVSPSQETCEFSWTIDDVANLCPAPIEESIPEHYEYTDPELELKAQEAINHYFYTMPMVVPSPWGPTASSDREQDAEQVSAEAVAAEQSSSSERISKHETDESAEEANLSTSTLRRKLFSQEQDGAEVSSLPTVNSPLRSGILFNASQIVCPSTPISKEQRIGTPLTKCKEINSPEVSPIRSLMLNSPALLKSHSPCSSPLGASPLQCFEGTVNMVQQWECEDRSMASVHSSYSAMVTSQTSTPTKHTSLRRLFSMEYLSDDRGVQSAFSSTPIKNRLMDISEKTDSNVQSAFSSTPIKNRLMDISEKTDSNVQSAFSSTPIKNRLMDISEKTDSNVQSAFSSTPIKNRLMDISEKTDSDDRGTQRAFSFTPIKGRFMDFSQFRNPIKKDSVEESDIDDLQDTGYQTGYINSGAISSAFSSLNNWSSLHQSQAVLASDNCEKLLYSISKTTAVEENSLWKPGCKYIISSTPTKTSS